MVALQGQVLRTHTWPGRTRSAPYPKGENGLMRFKNRFVAGAAIVTLASGGALVAAAGPASAATPNGGCWVYSPHTPADVEDTTLDSSTSTSLAAWADPTASPAGAADY